MLYDSYRPTGDDVPQECPGLQDSCRLLMWLPEGIVFFKKSLARRRDSVL